MQEAARTGVPSESRLPLEDKTVLEELRRVAVHGDDTTLDLLLSLQVKLGFSEEHGARAGLPILGTAAAVVTGSIGCLPLFEGVWNTAVSRPALCRPGEGA